MKNSLIILTVLIISNSALAQQTFNPNTIHNWENSRYIINTNDTVLDKKTGLIWKKCAQGLSDSTCTTGSATTLNWQQALSLANNSTFAGFSDWRLPNIKELRSLAAYDRFSPVINSDVFPNTPVSFFWSSSPVVSSISDSWRFGFNNGRDNGSFRSNSVYVRLVRGGQ